MAFISSFLQYFIVMVILAAIATAGVLIGKKIRDCKAAKNAAVSKEE